MTDNTNKFHLTWYDPGAAATGWAEFIVDFRAFSRPDNYIMEYLDWFNYGEFTGPEHDQMAKAVKQIQHTVQVWGLNVSMLQYEVGGEDFDLVQTIGSKENLLSPVRFNAVMAWECSKVGITYRLQAPAVRTSETRERMKLYGFMKPGQPMRKDAFAAMQHAVHRLKTIKQLANKRPWKLSEGGISNVYYDCSCSRPIRKGTKGLALKRTSGCDMLHPR